MSCFVFREPLWGSRCDAEPDTGPRTQEPNASTLNRKELLDHLPNANSSVLTAPKKAQYHSSATT